MPKLEPAVLDLRFTAAVGANTIDLMRAASEVNRRLYRQGRNVYVAGISVFCGTNLDETANANSIHVSTAPDSWITHNAWTKMFNLWNNQQKEAAKTVGASRPKWADFKVYLDDAHRTGSNDTEQFTQDGDSDSAARVLTAEDWDYSQIIWSDDDTTSGNDSGVPLVREPFIHIIGDDNGTASVGMIEQYEESRRTVNLEDPNIPTTASVSVFAKVADKGDTFETLVNDLESINDNPPYDHDAYPGGAANAPHPHMVGFATTAGGSAAIKGFKAPCGLLRVDVTGAAMDIIVHLMPGTYRGIMATPMGQ